MGAESRPKRPRQEKRKGKKRYSPGPVAAHTGFMAAHVNGNVICPQDRGGRAARTRGGARHGSEMVVLPIALAWLVIHEPA